MSKCSEVMISTLRELGITPTKEEIKELKKYKRRADAEPVFIKIRNKHWDEEGYKW